ncbi:MAG TPA: hypothetical protein VI689_03700 [Acidimicrobiia bacterium]|nr:hypothetical protein [Acidimicrobiia bacterium]
MPALEKFCSIDAGLGMRILSKAPQGMRIDFPFEGVATGPHWEGQRPVIGIDHATVREDGNMDLVIFGVIGEKRDSVAYTAWGVSIANPDQSADPKELITFQTGNEDLAWLNTEIGVALGHGESGRLTLEVYLVKP